MQAQGAAAWAPLDEIPWDTPSALTPERQELAWQLASQASYAEQAGLLTAAGLVDAFDDLGIRLNLALATADEARHAEVFARYAIVRGGRLEATEAHLEVMYDGLNALVDPLDRLIVHVLLEGFAVEELSVLAEGFQADLLGTIYKRVRRDEARHVAFGMAFIRDEVQRRFAGPNDFRRRAGELGSLTLALADIGPGTYAWLGQLTGRPPDDVRRWLEGRHEERVRQIPEARSRLIVN